MPRLKLTERSVSNLKAPTPNRRQLLYWDTSLKGFGVLCSGTSDVKTFVVKGTVHGRSVRRKLGRTNVLQLTEARLLAKEMIRDFSAGVDPRGRKASGAILRDAMDAYLKVHDLRPRTRESYRSAVERHLPNWLDLPLRSITRDMVEVRHRMIAEEVEQRHAKVAHDYARRHLARAERVEGQWPEAARRHRERWEAASKRKPPSGFATANGVMRALRAIWNYAAERVSDMPPNPVKLVRARSARVGPEVGVERKIAHRRARPSAMEGRPSVAGTPSPRQPVTQSGPQGHLCSLPIRLSPTATSGSVRPCSWTFTSVAIFGSHNRSQSSSDFFPTTRPAPPTWRRLAGATGLFAPIVSRGVSANHPSRLRKPENVAERHPSRGQSPAPASLPQRIYLPLQQAVLSVQRLPFPARHRGRRHRTLPTQSFTPEPGSILHVGGVGNNRIGKLCSS